MSAAQPVPSSTGAGEARPHEPSMEEILASIRRIIADDQSLAIAAAPPPAPVQRLHPEPVPAPEPPMAAQGSITAPQFPMPGPAPVEVVQPPIRVEAVDDVPQPEPAAVAPEPPHAEPAAAEPAVPEPAPVEPAPQASAQPPEPPREPSPLEPAPSSSAPLLSSSTHKSLASAFNVLAASRLADNSDELMALARDMIRPMLRAWIDENMPVMVERMVREEIERVARGGP